MTIAIKTSPHSTLAHCPDCDSEHIAPNPCGMTYRQRLGSQTLAQGWMPAKDKKRWWDESSLKEFWGGQSESERKEQLMDETKGIGAVSKEELHGEKGHKLAKAIGIAAD